MNLSSFFFLIVALTLSPYGFGADLETQTEHCDSCHGSLGVSTESDVPTIAGQTSEYITLTLALYKDWRRPCIKSAYRHGDTSRQATTMCEITENMARDEMEALGEYYAEQDFVAAKQDFDPALVASGAKLYAQHCESCHPQGGRISGPGPILAGQWARYLKSTVHKVLVAERPIPPLMNERVVDFSSKEIDSMVNFLASQQ